MIAKSILDTDILSEYLKGHDSVVGGHAARYAQEHGIFSFTTVTVYEIVYGLPPWLTRARTFVPPLLERCF